MKRTITICMTFALLVAASTVVGASDNKWILRGQYVKIWPSTDSYQTQSVLEDLPPIFNQLSLDSGQGFELDIEYKIKPKIGVVLTGIFTDMEGNFVYGTDPGQQNRFSSDPNTVSPLTPTRSILL